MRNTINAYTTYELNLMKDHNMKFMLGMNRVTYDMEYSQARRKQVNDIGESSIQLPFATGEQYVWGDKGLERPVGIFWSLQLRLCG